jgi:hypothetical protein
MKLVASFIAVLALLVSAATAERAAAWWTPGIIDLAVSAEAPAFASRYDHIVYDVTVVNRGSATARSVVLEGDVRGAYAYTVRAEAGGRSIACLRWGVGDVFVRCDLGSLPSGATARLRLEVGTDRPGYLFGYFEAHGRGIDLPPTNNSIQKLTSVS